MDIGLHSTTRRIAALGVAAVVIAGCNNRDNYAARNDSAAGTVVSTDTINRPLDRNGWTDESILAYLQAANMDEVKVNELAAKKATAAAVRQFAQKMVTDHRTGMKEVRSLMGKTMHDSTHAAMMRDSTHAKMMRDSTHAATGKTAMMRDTTYADTVHAQAHDVMKKTADKVKDLTDKKAGADWDKDYINGQIDDHKDVLDKLRDAAKSTTDKDLQALLVKVSGEVQEHLTKAEAIKATLK